MAYRLTLLSSWNISFHLYKLRILILLIFQCFWYTLDKWHLWNNEVRSKWQMWKGEVGWGGGGGKGGRTSRLSNPWVRNNAHHPLEKKIYRTILPSLQLKFIFVILHLPFNHTFITMIDSKFQVSGKISKNVCLHILIKEFIFKSIAIRALW